MLEIFLITLAFIWLIFAALRDIKTREVPNWLNFSLIIFALGVRFFYDLFNQGLVFSVNSLYIIFLILLVPYLVLFYLTYNFKTTKGEKIYFYSTFLFFVILIYFSYTGSFISKIILASGFIFSYQGILGMAIFFLLSKFFYSSRFFAGGDAKLMMALGPILPFYTDFSSNIISFVNFLLLFFFIGSVYGLFAAAYLGFRDYRKIKKNFVKNIKENKNPILIIVSFGVFIAFLSFIDSLFLLLGGMMIILPFLYVYTKTIDNSALVQKISSSKLTEGDWLYKDLKVRNKVIKSDWNGLSKKQIAEIRKKHKYVVIKKGIPFSPVFLISFAFFVYFYFFGSLTSYLWNSLG